MTAIVLFTPLPNVSATKSKRVSIFDMIRLDPERYNSDPETANRCRQAGAFRISAFLVHRNQQGQYGQARSSNILDNSSIDVVHYQS